jgi:hypothetical protein
MATGRNASVSSYFGSPILMTEAILNSLPHDRDHTSKTSICITKEGYLPILLGTHFLNYLNQFNFLNCKAHVYPKKEEAKRQTYKCVFQ